jgi:hypothetical protein
LGVPAVHGDNAIGIVLIVTAVMAVVDVNMDGDARGAVATRAGISGPTVADVRGAVLGLAKV